MMKSRTRRALVLTGSAVAVSLAPPGCSAINGILGGGRADADRDEATGPVTESARVDVKLGDCMLETGSGMLTDANVVPCSEPHDEEVFYEIKMDDGEYSEDAISAASEGCIGDAYTSFVGVSYQESALDVTTLSPSKDSWEQANDRVIQCIIVDPAGQVEGSLKGAAR